MKLTVVVDHMSAKMNMLAESGFSALIEHEGKRILFDTGLSDIVVRNLNALSVSVSSIDMLVLSHGHSDHTWGGAGLLVHGLDCPVFASVHVGVRHSIKENKRTMPGGLFSPLIENGFQAIEGVREIAKDIWALPTILRDEAYVPSTPHLLGECECADTFPDDLSLVLKGANGLTVLTGCAHGGIVNVLENAAVHFKTRKFDTVIGGFHMKDQEKPVIEKVVRRLGEMFHVKHWRPCHCTGFAAAAKLFKISEDVEWAGAGFSMQP